VAALEAVGAKGACRRDDGPWWAPLLQPVLSRASLRLARTLKARKEKGRRQERMKAARDAELIERRAAAVETKQAAAREREQRKLEAQARQTAARKRLEAFNARAFETYCTVREWARPWAEAGVATAVGRSDTERQVLRALAPMWEASPQTIAELRRHCQPLSGVAAADYESQSSPLAPRLKREAGFLRKQSGAELFVHEPPTLHGFGFAEQGALYNEDTVKGFTMLLALQDAAVLQGFRAPAHAEGRRVVWEIGGGWGGFAYQFKTVCPDVTYVITAPPDFFLISAVYLMSLFPDARCRFYDGTSDGWQDGWDRLDFVFVPDSALPSLGAPRLDLTIDAMALQHMTAPRACAHVQRAFELGSSFLYTLLPGVEPPEPVAVAPITRYFWPHPIPERRDPKMAGGPEAAAHRHLVGWRRMRV
jgi:putative sugar O-methyltransferase